MELVTFKCDVCGREKQASNHWWRVRVGNALHIYHWDYFGEGGEDDSIKHRHICGQECLMKVVQQFMDEPFGGA